eukprot:TRINITY_DN9390_c0_g1_i1.p1 TRINITY_DN9390_c0_g1~~TRINITY_DN9390_c0_g1_i1.p1  ORF type:complete len:180 (+),score=2.74 TRINITY_DN9390_c0_g1_i1:80-619(+)
MHIAPLILACLSLLVSCTVGQTVTASVWCFNGVCNGTPQLITIQLNTCNEVDACQLGSSRLFAVASSPSSYNVSIYLNKPDCTEAPTGTLSDAPCGRCENVQSVLSLNVPCSGATDSGSTTSTVATTGDATATTGPTTATTGPTTAAQAVTTTATTTNGANVLCSSIAILLAVLFVLML